MNTWVTDYRRIFLTEKSEEHEIERTDHTVLQGKCIINLNRNDQRAEWASKTLNYITRLVGEIGDQTYTPKPESLKTDEEKEADRKTDWIELQKRINEYDTNPLRFYYSFIPLALGVNKGTNKTWWADNVKKHGQKFIDLMKNKTIAFKAWLQPQDFRVVWTNTNKLIDK
jgi:hypothetical protein